MVQPLKRRSFLEIFEYLQAGFSLSTEASPVDDLFDAAIDLMLLLARASKEFLPIKPEETPEVEFPKTRKTAFQASFYEDNLVDALHNVLTRKKRSLIKYTLTEDAYNFFYALASLFVKLRRGVSYKNAFAAFRNSRLFSDNKPETPKKILRSTKKPLQASKFYHQRRKRRSFQDLT